MPSSSGQYDATLEHRALLAYVADLELEVDRLRKQCRCVQQEAREMAQRIRPLYADTVQPGIAPDRVGEIGKIMRQFADVLRDVREPLDYHPPHDRVMAIAMRPLVDQVFRWQQQLLNAPHVAIRLDLQSEQIDWFPARLRHILENLISNGIRYRSVGKSETRLTLGLRALPAGYELRVSDNGIGMRAKKRADVEELFYRSAPARAAGLGVGLAVTRLLLEQSGGTLTMSSDEKLGTTAIAFLPHFGIDDFLEDTAAASPSFAS